MTDLDEANLRIKYLEQQLAAAKETLRDKFATAAMGTLNWSVGYVDRCAKHCYDIADAMIEARKPK